MQNQRCDLGPFRPRPRFREDDPCRVLRRQARDISTEIDQAGNIALGSMRRPLMLSEACTLGGGTSGPSSRPPNPPPPSLLSVPLRNHALFYLDRAQCPRQPRVRRPLQIPFPTSDRFATQPLRWS
jgi:hypothetical protein